MEGFPGEVKQGELLWVDAESPTEQELADLKQRFGLDDYAVEDVVNKGDELTVRVVELDKARGRIGLRLADDPAIEGKSVEELAAMGTGNGRPRRDGDRDRGRGRGRDRDRDRRSPRSRAE